MPVSSVAWTHKATRENQPLPPDWRTTRRRSSRVTGISSSIPTPLTPGARTSPLEVLSTLLPASFEARADKGTIQIRSNLKFLPSPTGAVKFFAHQDIQGVPKFGRGDDPNFIWLFVGYGGVSGGQWVAVDQRTIPQRPDLWPFLSNYDGGPTLPKEAGSPPAISS